MPGTHCHGGGGSGDQPRGCEHVSSDAEPLQPATDGTSTSVDRVAPSPVKHGMSSRSVAQPYQLLAGVAGFAGPPKAQVPAGSPGRRAERDEWEARGPAVASGP